VPDDLHAKRAVNPVREGLERTGLYHSIRLPDGNVLEGAMPVEYQEDRWRWFDLPDDLTGLRALDVGPWDGYFTFELERRGAEVTAIDYADLDTFRKLHRLFNSRAKYLTLDVYDASRDLLGEFDIVLLLGVLYHLKHPLLALERICAITREMCIIDTYVVDPEEYRQGQSAAIPYAEFFERGELGGQLDNWCGPSVTQVMAWARAAGFARCDVLKVTSTTVCVRADRRWRNIPAPTEAPVVLIGVNSPAHGGRCFRSHQEEYLNFWLEWTGPAAPPLDEVFPEVDGFGVAPMFTELTSFGAIVTTRVPPGLSPGRHDCRLRIGSSGWSNLSPIYMDVENLNGTLLVGAIQDAISFREGEVDWANGGWLTVWVSGLSDLADVGNVTVEIDGVPHRPQAVAETQVNLQLRPLFEAGEHRLVVAHRGLRSESQTFLLCGAAPVIKGFGR
jgi:tRNA (mo5U34)-methyltransferase